MMQARSLDGLLTERNPLWFSHQNLSPFLQSGTITHSHQSIGTCSLFQNYPRVCQLQRPHPLDCWRLFIWSSCLIRLHLTSVLKQSLKLATIPNSRSLFRFPALFYLLLHLVIPPTPNQLKSHGSRCRILYHKLLSVAVSVEFRDHLTQSSCSLVSWAFCRDAKSIRNSDWNCSPWLSNRNNCSGQVVFLLV